MPRRQPWFRGELHCQPSMKQHRPRTVGRLWCARPLGTVQCGRMSICMQGSWGIRGHGHPGARGISWFLQSPAGVLMPTLGIAAKTECRVVCNDSQPTSLNPLLSRIFFRRKSTFASCWCAWKCIWWPLSDGSFLPRIKMLMGSRGNNGLSLYCERCLKPEAYCSSPLSGPKYKEWTKIKVGFGIHG